MRMGEHAPSSGESLTDGVERAQLEAMIRLLLDSGDLSPMGARMLRRL